MKARGIRRIVICTLVAIACMAFSVSAYAETTANEAVQNARNGVVQVKVLYEGDDGQEYSIQWGSGFLIDEMTVMTCYHVVYPTEDTIKDMREAFESEVGNKSDKQIRERLKLKITVYRDSSVTAEVAEGVDSEAADYVALTLKKPLADYKPLTIRNSDKVEVTEPCFALGFPEKMQYFKEGNATFTKDDVDITSGTIKSVNTTNESKVMSFSGTITEGYSGGPLVDNDGNCIGIAFAGDDENQSYAVASSEFIPSLKTLGYKLSIVDDDESTEATEETTEATEETQTTTAASVPDPQATKEEKKSFPLIPVIIAIAIAVIIAILIIFLVTRKKKANVPEPVTSYSAGSTPGGPVPPTATGSAPNVPAYSGGVDTGVLGQGSNETTVLGQGSNETTVLSATQQNGALVRSKTGERIAISKDNFKIGRERSRVDYCISDNTAVGRHHATIVCRNGEVFLVDQNSRNFTFINDIKSAPNVETKLNDGDKISFGDEVFTFNSK